MHGYGRGRGSGCKGRRMCRCGCACGPRMRPPPPLSPPTPALRTVFVRARCCCRAASRGAPPCPAHSAQARRRAAPVPAAPPERVACASRCRAAPERPPFPRTGSLTRVACGGRLPRWCTGRRWLCWRGRAAVPTSTTTGWTWNSRVPAAQIRGVAGAGAVSRAAAPRRQGVRESVACSWGGSLHRSSTGGVRHFGASPLSFRPPHRKAGVRGCRRGRAHPPPPPRSPAAHEAFDSRVCAATSGRALDRFPVRFVDKEQI